MSLPIVQKDYTSANYAEIKSTNTIASLLYVQAVYPITTVV